MIQETPNPYEPPRAPIEPSLAVGGEALTYEEVKAFVGPSTGYYWNRWQGVGLFGSAKTSFHWPCFFLQGIWLMYRRMWREFGIYMAVMVGLGVVQVFVEEAMSPESAKLLDRLTNFATALVMAFMANGLYLKRAQSAIAAARGNPDPVRKYEQLRQAGGTSWLGVGVALVIFAGLVIIGIALADT